MRGEFLDGAALAAQELGRKNLPACLERAWREAPTLLRLQRWLGSSGSKRAVRRRAAEALAACPKPARRQRAFLHVIVGEPESAAKLLTSAPGLGWSKAEHPGHVLVGVFAALLRGDPAASLADVIHLPVRAIAFTELDWSSEDEDEPRLAAPAIGEILDAAAVDRPLEGGARKAVLAALRTAARKRLRGVVENKRRRYYGHAAELVATCAELDPSPSTRKWVEGLRANYRRYSALQRELDRRLEGTGA